MGELRDPQALLGILENQLRDLVRDVLEHKHGDRWEDVLPADYQTLKKWRKATARERRSGTRPDGRLLYQATLNELAAMLVSDPLWSLVEPCFSNRDELRVDLERLRRYRNTLAHGRDLVPFEEDLVRGLVGQRRQEITMFRSAGAGGPEPEYFARIEEIVDSFGNRAAAGQEFVDTDLTLRPGDSITFTGSASHPYGKAVRWRMWPLSVHDELNEVDGERFRWQVAITERHINVRCDFRFQLASIDPPHAHGSWDGECDFRYRVLPELPPGRSQVSDGRDGLRPST